MGIFNIKLAIAILCFCLYGCSSTSVAPNIAKAVKSAPNFSFQQGRVALTIVRDNGLVSGGCSITVLIDGDDVAQLGTGEKTTAYVNPGNITVGAGFMGRGFCNGGSVKERDFVIEQNKPKNLRIFIDQSGNIDILPTTLK